jgi:holliday junction resolvase Hjr
LRSNRAAMFFANLLEKGCMKVKGSVAERELVAMFWNTGEWSALRIAGSGRMNFPSPDVLAGNGSQIFAIECKSTKHTRQYIEDDQIQQLKDFAAKFGAKPVIAVKFSTKWHFYDPEDMERTPKGAHMIHKEKHAHRKKEFEDLIL